MKIYYVKGNKVKELNIKIVDKKKIFMKKFMKYTSYFSTYNEALNYLFFLRLENLVDNFQGRKGYLSTKDLEGALKALKNITLEIENLKK